MLQSTWQVSGCGEEAEWQVDYLSAGPGTAPQLPPAGSLIELTGRVGMRRDLEATLAGHRWLASMLFSGPEPVREAAMQLTVAEQSAEARLSNGRLLLVLPLLLSKSTEARRALDAAGVPPIADSAVVKGKHVLVGLLVCPLVEPEPEPLPDRDEGLAGRVAQAVRVLSEADGLAESAEARAVLKAMACLVAIDRCASVEAGPAPAGQPD